MLQKYKLFFLLILCLVVTTSAFSQIKNKPNTNTKVIAIGDSTKIDSTKATEDAPLDISQDRGLFLYSAKKQTQLRILGSVRFLALFDSHNLTAKNTLNTFEIPTNDAHHYQPNYYNGLDQTRLGFEVTRKTGAGDIFIRLETDFAGSNGFRIRHAYGQYNNFLVGQTWSLFSQINLRPATVSTRGPTGSISQRTPQLRYTFSNAKKGTDLAIGLEYSIPDITIPDSVLIETFQLFPDITFRFRKRADWGNVQISGVLPLLTGSTEADQIKIVPGWGVSVGASIVAGKKGNISVQWAGGNAISRFFTDLRSQGLDVVLDPINSAVILPFAQGGYAAYTHNFTAKLSSNAIVGYVSLKNPGFATLPNYEVGTSYRVNTFYEIVAGARVGVELNAAARKNIDATHGYTARLSALFYYDF